jgi:putative transposase
MSQPEYRWRQLTPKQQAELLAWRKARGQPWHSPPHRPNFGHLRFHITAACFEHQPCIGHSPERMDAFARDLLAVFAAHARQAFAGCVLPNQRTTDDSDDTDEERLGTEAPRTDISRRRKPRPVPMSSVKSVVSTSGSSCLHHGYVPRWTDWPWSSASEYLAQTDPDEAKRIWHDYPLGNYGKGWDEPGM